MHNVFFLFFEYIIIFKISQNFISRSNLKWRVLIFKNTCIFRKKDLSISSTIFVILSSTRFLCSSTIFIVFKKITYSQAILHPRRTREREPNLTRNKRGKHMLTSADHQKRSGAALPRMHVNHQPGSR